MATSGWTLIVEPRSAGGATGNGSGIIFGDNAGAAGTRAQASIRWATSYPAPGSSGFALAAMSALTLVAATGSMYNQAAGGGALVNPANYGDLADMASKRFSATKQVREWAYVLTNLKEGKESGPGLLAISLATGEPGKQVIFKDKEPEYEVDDIEGRLFYFNDKKQVVSYLLK